VGIDETSLRRGQDYITVVHDLEAKRLLFATEGKSHATVIEFAADLKAHGGDPADVRHVCMDMSAAFAKGTGLALPAASIMTLPLLSVVLSNLFTRRLCAVPRASVARTASG
jgi:transposase